MKNGLILCEGITDFTLLQYYLESVYGWKDEIRGEEQRRILRFAGQGTKSRKFLSKDHDRTLTIAATGGVSKIFPCLKDVITLNKISTPDDTFYNRIMIFTDNDDVGTKQQWHDDILGYICSVDGIVVESSNEDRFYCKIKRNVDYDNFFEIILMVLPYNEIGALETFLLESISEDDKYDANIIKKGNEFVENVDPEGRYLKQRRLLTKAKFDVYFSVRSPQEQFGMRRDILRNIKWQNYEKINDAFKIFEEF